jgi:hypothetical protein
MNERAEVRSIDALKHAKAALLEFAKEAAASLAAADVDVQRMSQWLSHDRPSHWKREVRKREEIVLEWRKEISRKQMIAAPEPASTVEERKKMQKAQLRVDVAKQKLLKTQKWANTWEKEVQLYKTSTSMLGEFLARDIPNAVARIERMMINLEEYFAIQAPEAPTVPPTPGEDAPELPLPEMDLRLDTALSSAEIYARLRTHVPDQETRDDVALRTVPELSGSRLTLLDSELLPLSRLALYGPLPQPGEKVVVSARAIAHHAVFFARSLESPAGDSGWYVGPEERPDAHGGLRAVTVEDLLSAIPALAPLLRLAPGALAVLVEGSIRAVLDAENKNNWEQKHS